MWKTIRHRLGKPDEAEIAEDMETVSGKAPHLWAWKSLSVAGHFGEFHKVFHILILRSEYAGISRNYCYNYEVQRKESHETQRVF